jgi:hypothetical protein
MPASSASPRWTASPTPKSPRKSTGRTGRRWPAIVAVRRFGSSRADALDVQIAALAGQYRAARNILVLLRDPDIRSDPALTEDLLPLFAWWIGALACGGD